MKKSNFFALLISILLSVSLFTLPTSAASMPKAEDFAEVFTTGITCSDTDNGVKMTFGDGRITYMKPVRMDGLKVVFEQVSLTAPTTDFPLGIWINFGQEAGHYWGLGATGTIFRVNNTVDGVEAYVKQADDMDDGGDDIFLPPTKIGLKDFSDTLTMTFNKVGNQYEVSMNDVKFQVDAAKIDATLSSSGKSFFTFGIYDPSGSKDNSLVVAEISNSKALTATTTMTATTTTTTAANVTTDAADTGTTETIMLMVVMVLVVTVGAVFFLFKKVKKQ